VMGDASQKLKRGKPCKMANPRLEFWVSQKVDAREKRGEF